MPRFSSGKGFKGKISRKRDLVNYDLWGTTDTNLIDVVRCYNYKAFLFSLNLSIFTLFRY